MTRVIAVWLLVFALISFASTSNQPSVSDPQAVAYAAQSIAALTGGQAISDIMLTGNVTWIAGSDTDTGTATLSASGTGDSRVDLSLSSGTRTEIRDARRANARGKWISQSGASGYFTTHNCQTDAVWFFPALSSLVPNPNVILSYVGQETRNGVTVQHIRSYANQPVQTSSSIQQRLSRTDFYLDATTLLPLVITFNAHPDNNLRINIPVEIDFSDYQTLSGIAVPRRCPELR